MMIAVDTVVLIEEPIIIIATIHNALLLTHLVYKNYCSSRLSQECTGSKSLHQLTILTLLSFLSLNIISLLTIFALYYPNLLHCKYWILICLIIYYLSRFFFWYYCVIRIKIAFCDASHLQYTERFLFILKIIFLSASIGLCINFYFNITTFNKKDHCWIITPFWVFPFDGLIQAILSIICYWLFHRKMRLIMVNIKDLAILQQHSSSSEAIAVSSDIGIEPAPSNQAVTGRHSRSSSLSEIKHNVQYDYQLLYITRKYAILTAISVITTWILIICTIPMGSVLGIGSIDSIINSWCIVLFGVKYNNIYIKICSCIAKQEWYDLNNNNNINPEIRKQSKSIIDGVNDKCEGNKNKQKQNAMICNTKETICCDLEMGEEQINEIQTNITDQVNTENIC